MISQPDSQNFRSLLLSPWVLSAFLICALVWFYLFYVTRTIVIWDAEGFEILGKRIYQEGWIETFKQGPYREFGYSFLISVSMKMADWFSINYLTIQRFIQLLFLFATQVAALYILYKLKVKPFLCALAVGYIGLSPGLLNSALILYSEIAAYPFILLIIIIGSKAYSHLLQNKTVVVPSILLGLSFFCVTSVKGVFEPLSYLFLLPFALIAWQAYAKKKTIQFKNCVIFFALFALFFYVPINGYKLANKVYNGEFTLSDRGGRILLASTIPRVADLNKRQILALIPHAAGQGYCTNYFDADSCSHWEWWSADAQVHERIEAYAKENGLQTPLKQKTITKIALKEILSRPFQYAFITTLHSLKIFVWEYFYGFVAYPDWMDKFFLNGRTMEAYLYTSTPLALISLLYLIYYIFRNRSQMLNLVNIDEKFHILLMFSVVLISFILLSSLFWIIRRYVLIIAPLYIICIAFTINQIIFRKS